MHDISYLDDCLQMHIIYAQFHALFTLCVHVWDTCVYRCVVHIQVEVVECKTCTTEGACGFQGKPQCWFKGLRRPHPDGTELAVPASNLHWCAIIKLQADASHEACKQTHKHTEECLERDSIVEQREATWIFQAASRLGEIGFLHDILLPTLAHGKDTLEVLEVVTDCCAFQTKLAAEGIGGLGEVGEVGG